MTDLSWCAEIVGALSDVAVGTAAVVAAYVAWRGLKTWYIHRTTPRTPPRARPAWLDSFSILFRSVSSGRVAKGGWAADRAAGAGAVYVPLTRAGGTSR